MYLFIGLVFGRNFVQSLHLKWVPMFLAIFFLHVILRVIQLIPKTGHPWDVMGSHHGLLAVARWRRLAGTSAMVM